MGLDFFHFDMKFINSLGEAKLLAMTCVNFADIIVLFVTIENLQKLAPSFTTNILVPARSSDSRIAGVGLGFR